MPGVSATLDDGDARSQTEVASCLDGQALDGLTQRQNVLRKLFEDVATTNLFEELNRPTAEITVVVTTDCSSVQVHSPAAGQLKGQPVRSVDNAVCLLVDFRLVFLQPGCLEWVPLSSNRHGATTVIQLRPALGLVASLGLLNGSNVHPHNGVAKGVTLLVESNDGHRGCVVGDARDLTSRDTGLVEDAANGGLQCLPPVSRRLLCLTRTREVRLVWSACKTQRVTTKVENRSAARFRTEINA